MFVAKANGQVVAYGRVIELATDEAAAGTPAVYYLSGVLVDPAWRGRGIATALTRARLRWAFARASTVFYVTGADNVASLHLHAALGFEEAKRFESERSAASESVSVGIGLRRALLWSTFVVSNQRPGLGVARREGAAGFADSGAAAAGVIEHLARSGAHPSLSRADPEGSFPLGQLPDYRVDLASVAGAKPLKILLVPATPVAWAQL